MRAASQAQASTLGYFQSSLQPNLQPQLQPNLQPHLQPAKSAMQHSHSGSHAAPWQDDMGATAMSIDTPSYARTLGLSQPGTPSNAGGQMHDLAQDMSIDCSQPWDTFRPGATFACKALALHSAVNHHVGVWQLLSAVTIQLVKIPHQ